VGLGKGEAGGERSLQAWQLAPHAPIVAGAVVWLALGRPTGATGIALAVATVALAAALHGRAWQSLQEHQARRDELVAELAQTEAKLDHRAAVSELFVHLARRNQSLLDRQIGLLVDLEHVESDPDALAELFKLDHLATRMRRNAESLLVLAGEETPRRWGRPVALADVVRAAVAEVEHVTRASIIIDEHLELSGRAVADVAHLLAELVENALTFSPPDTRVTVRNHLTRGHNRACLITIEDRGIGMAVTDIAAANELLAEPSDVGLALTQQLGFHVVARLGTRHGIEVSLAPTPGGGVTAVVRIPSSLFPSDDDGVGDDAHPAGARVTEPAPAVTAAPAGGAGPMAGPGVAAAPLRAIPASAISLDPLVDPASLPVAPRTAAVVSQPLPAAASVDPPIDLSVDWSHGSDASEESDNPALRRRTPGLSLGMAAPAGLPSLSPEPRPAPSRSPEEVRAMLSRFQTSQAAGREHAETDGG
jgi:signal transduction histidine kinase